MKILKSQLNAIEKSAQKIIDICGEMNIMNIKSPKEELMGRVSDIDAEMEVDKVHEEVVVEPQDPTEVQ